MAMRRTSSTGSPGLRHQAICIAVENRSGALKAEIERQNHVQLVAKLASSRGLITERVTQSMLDDLEKAKQLVSAAIAQIKQDVSGESYSVFLSILRSVPSLEPTATKLVEEESRTNTRLRFESAVAVCRPHQASSVPYDDSGFQEDPNPGELPREPSGEELVLATRSLRPAQSVQPEQAGDAGATPLNVHNEEPQTAVIDPRFPLQESQTREILLRNQKAEPLPLEDDMKKKDAKIRDLQGDIAEMKHYETTLQTQLETATQEMDKMEVQLKKMEIKLEEMRKSSDAEIKKLRQQLQDSEKEVETCRSQVAQKEKQSHEQLEAAEVKFNKIQSRLAEIRAEYAIEIGHLSERLSDLREQLCEKETERAKAAEEGSRATSSRAE